MFTVKITLFLMLSGIGISSSAWAQVRPASEIQVEYKDFSLTWNPTIDQESERLRVEDKLYEGSQMHLLSAYQAALTVVIGVEKMTQNLLRTSGLGGDSYYEAKFGASNLYGVKRISESNAWIAIKALGMYFNSRSQVNPDEYIRASQAWSGMKSRGFSALYPEEISISKPELLQRLYQIHHKYSRSDDQPLTYLLMPSGEQTKIRSIDIIGKPDGSLGLRYTAIGSILDSRSEWLYVSPQEMRLQSQTLLQELLEYDNYGAINLLQWLILR